MNSEVVAEPGKERVYVKIYFTRPFANSPPMSAVRTLPSLITSNVALAMWFAIGSSLGEDEKKCGYARPEHIPKMPEHHGGTKNHGGRVCTIGAHDIAGDVTASWLE